MKSCPACNRPFDKPRSMPHHRRFFAVIDAAFPQWPEGADFQPTDSEQLRAYLLVKTGYYTLTVIDPQCPDTLNVLRSSAYTFVLTKNDRIEIYTPKSIAKMGQREFAPVADAVDAAIEKYVGVSADKLLRETKEVA